MCGKDHSSFKLYMIIPKIYCLQFPRCKFGSFN